MFLTETWSFYDLLLCGLGSQH